MLRILIEVDRQAGQAIGIKEQIAMDLEKYGDVRVVSVDEVCTTEQMRMEHTK